VNFKSLLVTRQIFYALKDVAILGHRCDRSVSVTFGRRHELVGSGAVVGRISFVMTFKDISRGARHLRPSPAVNYDQVEQWEIDAINFIAE
jgi:hypothetical protein